MFFEKGLPFPLCQRDTGPDPPTRNTGARAMINISSKLTNRVITLAVGGYSLVFLAQIASQYAA